MPRVMSCKAELKRRKLTVMHENFSDSVENWGMRELKKQDIKNLINKEGLLLRGAKERIKIAWRGNQPWR